MLRHILDELLAHAMPDAGVAPDTWTFNLALRACGHPTKQRSLDRSLLGDKHDGGADADAGEARRRTTKDSTTPRQQAAAASPSDKSEEGARRGPAGDVRGAGSHGGRGNAAGHGHLQLLHRSLRCGSTDHSADLALGFLRDLNQRDESQQRQRKQQSQPPGKPRRSGRYNIGVPPIRE